MDTTTASRSRGGIASFVRLSRGFAEASLLAMGLAVVLLLIGTPVALIVRGLHEGLSWLVRLRGDASPLLDAIVSVSSVIGGIVLTAALVRRLVGFFGRRRRLRARRPAGQEHATRARGKDVPGTSAMQKPGADVIPGGIIDRDERRQGHSGIERGGIIGAWR
jgi:hypothetical protein